MTTIALIALALLQGAAPQRSLTFLPGDGDDYTRYELLAPETAQFRIVYDVTSTTPGATFYFNPIRKGSIATDESVVDLMTGAPLKFEVVSGEQARAAGHARADLETDYIKVHLARPVPEGGGGRIRIFKTYKDPKSYFVQGDLIVFDRSLGIRRNSVVLPAGYELVACNVPSQVIPEADGRTTISFMNISPGPAPLVVKARKLPAAAATSTAGSSSGNGNGGQPPRAQAPPAMAAATPEPALSARFPGSERAFQDREIVYFLEQPESHAFSLYHDYTETREGVDRYVNVVRAGSTVSNPSALVLDTGEKLATETLKGEAISRAKIDIGGPAGPGSEAVVIRFPPVKKGQSVRLRIAETYTDPGRYALIGDELVWRRSFGRPRNAMVLPDGWYLTASSIPAAVSQLPDGRIRLDYDNPRPDSVDVFLKARRRGR
jgi:hypothetical protein